MATAIDPICKMEVDTDNPPGGRSEHEGTTYYFCAPGCKVAFEQDPHAYLGEYDHGHGDHEGHDHEGHDHEGHDHGQHEGHDHGAHDHGHTSANAAPEKKPGFFAKLFGRG
jgi:YHS domain-containing protein